MSLPFLAGSPALLDGRFPLPLDRPFTTKSARDAGLTDKHLHLLVGTGYLRRPIKGVYVAAQVPDSRALRGQVLALVVPAGSVVCDWTACWYWTGLDRPGSHVTVPRLSIFRFRGRERLRNSLASSGERWFQPGDVRRVEGNLLITTQLRTAWDLGRFSPRIIAVGGMDALLRTGAFTSGELLDGVERFRRQRGVVQLRYLAPLTDARSESPGESALRLRWLETPGLPAPESQVEIHGATGTLLFRVDLGVEELRFGAEYDGEEWHGEEHEKHDKARRGAIASEFGWHLEVFRKANVFGQHADVSERLSRALLDSRRRHW